MRRKTAILAFFAVLLLLEFVGAQEEPTDEASAGAGLGEIKFLAAGLAVGLSGIGAAFAIAKVGVAASGAIVENPKLFGNTILYVAFAEAIAIYGLLVAILIIGG